MKQAPIIVAILIAGGLIAFSIQSGGSPASAHHAVQQEQETTSAFRQPSPETDHIRGSLDAPITIIEFSDYQCPFCKTLHPTLKELTETRDDVNWVYRNLPLASHSRAFEAATAAECVGVIAGGDAFWEFSDRLFASQRSISPELYTQIATELGVDIPTLLACMESDEVSEQVKADRNEAFALGAGGTPFGVILTPDNVLMPFTGPLSLAQFNTAIDNILAQQHE